MTNSVVLSCTDLSKSYEQGPQKVRVLSSVNFEVLAGQRVAIIGSSGSGKSTLLNLLGGLDKPDSGEVKINDQPFSSLSDNQRGLVRNQSLGFVYQFHHLLAEFTALENVAMPLQIGGVDKKNAYMKAAELLAKVGLAERQHHKPSELSGGERQRVAIARALANSPSCVLMDEPTGNLDSKNAAVIQQLMLDLARDLHTSFVIVTHDDRLASALDKRYVLDEGCLQLVMDNNNGVQG